jgi:hypothetical protein
MKERPIVFSGPMVLALLAGTKTQTRRVVKPQPCDGFHLGFDDMGRLLVPTSSGVLPVKCPYGQPGDRLWVREAWRVAECYDERRGSDLRFTLSARNVQYAAGEQFLGVVQGRYRHARFMPRWASRILLEVTGVRVERLQEISEADANAEGCDLPAVDQDWHQCRRWFRGLWESINGHGSWDANPWVRVVEFRRIDTGAV